MIGTWRQQQARQNYLDSVGAAGLSGFPGESRIVDEAIEVATTVKITQDAVEALVSAMSHEGLDEAGALAKALQELGFEVVQ